MISLVPCHGQGYLVKSDNFFNEERIKIPMIFRGKNIPNGVCRELISGLDLLLIMLNAAGINEFDNLLNRGV